MEATDSSTFEVREIAAADGVAQVLLIGELDLAGVAKLDECLERLRRAGTPVRLDLSELRFIDSSGLRALVTSRRDSEQNAWRLEIGTELCPQVRKLVDLTGLGPTLWPESGDGAQPASD
ncbi:MAG: STAS domain-containing protein [Solirubrobacteraceae bacterium]